MRQVIFMLGFIVLWDPVSILASDPAKSLFLRDSSGITITVTTDVTETECTCTETSAASTTSFLSTTTAPMSLTTDTIVVTVPVTQTETLPGNEHTVTETVSTPTTVIVSYFSTGATVVTVPVTQTDTLPGNEHTVTETVSTPTTVIVSYFSTGTTVVTVPVTQTDTLPGNEHTITETVPTPTTTLQSHTLGERTYYNRDRANADDSNGLLFQYGHAFGERTYYNRDCADTDDIPVTRTRTIPVTNVISSVTQADTALGKELGITTPDTSIRICPSLKTNPTYTPPTPLPTNYLWGCPPNTLCNPNHTERCIEASLPAESYVCSPENCIETPPLPSPEFWGIPIESNETGKFQPPPKYFNINPHYFGLPYDIFIFGSSEAKLSYRQITTTVPPMCYDECNDCALEAQRKGKVPGLCSPGSDFQELKGLCEACIHNHSEPTEFSITAVLPDFVQFLSYCGETIAASTISVSDTKTTSAASVGRSATLSWKNYSVTASGSQRITAEARPSLSASSYRHVRELQKVLGFKVLECLKGITSPDAGYLRFYLSSTISRLACHGNIWQPTIYRVVKRASAPHLFFGFVSCTIAVIESYSRQVALLPSLLVCLGSCQREDLYGNLAYTEGMSLGLSKCMTYIIHSLVTSLKWWWLRAERRSQASCEANITYTNTAVTWKSIECSLPDTGELIYYEQMLPPSIVLSTSNRTAFMSSFDSSRANDPLPLTSNNDSTHLH
ncbi:conserved hypothetical protein [Talaromyces stipitatus ATCC 10500]|uniref:Glycoprotein X n=1 Tax=Talaromyces stipitatus (strain ATCC 10500 / CBS 375.48 / QM 6759 / NRRL 1006) TaxID=441959 RepID=B8MUR4_TALSN|nr:uncharacterized protein TSTA_109820 [Talaromyces stipitatus ATCC 10500]EED11802.1 conserved hypothetical protein [Talaromyces stipitatus ATCC 10500]